MEQNQLLELIPLGYAMRDAASGQKENLAPALDVNPKWLSNPVAASLYKEWQSLARPEDRWEWIYNQTATQPLVIEAMNAANEGIISARDAVNQIRTNWHNAQEQRYLHELTTATDGAKKINALDKLNALYGATDSQAYEVDMTNPPPENECMLERDGIPFLPRCEITAIKAKAKSGKTHLCQWWAAAAIGTAGKFIRPSDKEEIPPPRRVLYVDTEQSKRSSYKTMRNIVWMAGYDTRENHPELTVWNLRSLHTDERMPFLQGMVATGKYDLVILDGIKDLTKDINDNQEADRVLNTLTNLVETYNIALLTVLHENPSKDADKMRGHLGTELLNKAFDVFEISLDRDAGVFNILHTDSRDKPLPIWALHFVEDPDNPGHDTLEECEPTKHEGAKDTTATATAKPQTKEEKVTDAFVRIFMADGLSRTYKELCKSFMIITEKSERTFADWLKAADAYGLVSKNEEGWYGRTPKLDHLIGLKRGEQMISENNDEDPPF